MNNKLIINTNLLRKESEFKTYTCIVEKAVPVPTEEFERLKHTPMCNNDLISENLNSMWYGNGVHHCLLIYDKQQGDGLLIESEGAPMQDMPSIFQTPNCCTKIICRIIYRN